MTLRKTVRLCLFLLVLNLAAWGCQSREERETKSAPLQISVAIGSSLYSGLVAIADGKGFFKESGLVVLIKEYPSGLLAVEAMLRGEVQMATAADLIFVLKSGDEPSLRIVASIGLANTSRIVARKDRNITEPNDLRGKRIGVTPNTISEYYLSTFLLFHRIPRSEVTVVNLPPDGMAKALAGGEVDAISVWDVFVYQAKTRLGENAVSWEAQNTQDFHWILMAREGMIRSPEPLKRFLKGLVIAQGFLLSHEDEAKGIIMRRWGFEPGFIRENWEGTRMDVSLSQSLLRSLDNAAEWKMHQDGKSAELPNFLNYIYTSALEEVDPRAVTIFR
jgi:ABC-type nitrate/sulfonate/bicarbonate transport system substrate-binding protein